MTVYLGRHYTTAESSTTTAGSGELTGCVYQPSDENLWVTALGGVFADLGNTDPNVRIALYDSGLGSGGQSTDTRVCYSNTQATTSGTLNDYDLTLDGIDVGTTAAAMFSSGHYPLIAILATSGDLTVSLKSYTAISADNERIYRTTGESQPPPDPYGGWYDATITGHMTLWAECEINVAPETPDTADMDPSGSVNETAPTFTCPYLDENAGDGGTDVGDTLNQYGIQVRRVSDATSFWDTTVTASGAEIAADAVSKAYGGTTLVRGTAYEWRHRQSDLFGTWSSWSSWLTFTPAALGYVTLDSDPTSKIEDNTPDFKGRWNHQSATTMKTVQTRILNGSGTTVLQTGADFNIADVNSAAAPGTLFTVAWADTGLSTLAWGTSYQYQTRGYDGTNWSDWSTARTFNTDAAPSIPANLAPTGSQASAAYPLLTCTATDTDDTTGTGFVVYARIKNSGGTVLDTKAMTYNTGNGKWEYQIDGTETGWGGYATYKWDAYSYDGTLYSGEASSSGDATKSSEATFVYAAGPSITIDTPTADQVLTSSSVAVTWTVADQARYRVYLYEDAGSTVIYDSGETITATGSHTIPSGYVENDTAYDLVVWIRNTAPLDGYSTIRDFTIDYTEPDVVANFVANAISVTADLWPSSIQLNWDATAYGTDVWQEYTLYRSAASGPDATEIILARITSPTQTAYIDYTPVSGIEYTYRINQTIMTGLDYLTSVSAEASTQVDLGGIVLCDIANPSTLRSVLRHTKERSHERTIDEAVYQPLSGSKPTTVRSRTQFWSVKFDAWLIDDDATDAATRKSELETLDAGQGTLCYRDEKGRKYFCTMPQRITIDYVPDYYRAQIGLREQKYSEGVD